MSAFLRRLQNLHRDDRGTSLAELVVGMTVMGVFMAIFTTAVVSLARTTTKIEAVTSSAAQVNNAFLTVDKTVRYATGITSPGPAPSGPGQDVYVELSGSRARVPSDVPGDAQVAICTQLRVHFDANPAQQLQMRTWDAGTEPPPDWRMLANNITNGAEVAPSTDQPFTTPPLRPGVTTDFQRLAITLIAGTSGSSSNSTTRTSVAFTALNSSIADPTDVTACTPVGVRQ